MARGTLDVPVECSGAFTTGCAGASERRALTPLEKVVDVAGDAERGNRVADLGTGGRELDDYADDDNGEADDSQTQGVSPGPRLADPIRRPLQPLLHPLRF